MKRYSLVAALSLALLAFARPLPAEAPDTPLKPDKHTLILSHLDSEADVANPAFIRAGHGSLSGKAGQDYEFVEGRFGKAVLIKDKGVLSFPATGGNFPVEVGSAEMWLKPARPWKGWETPFQRGGTMWDEYGRNMIDMHFDAPGVLVMSISGQGGSLRVDGKVGDWPVGQWHHLTLCWDLPAGKGAIYLDGTLVGQASGKPFTLPDGAGGIRINARGGNAMVAAVDELRISDVWRYPGSDNYQGEAIEPLPADRALNEDPGFETCELGTMGNPKPAWNTGEGARDATWELVSDNPHSGARCLKVTQPARGAGKALVATRQVWIPAQGGRTYRFTAWMRTDAPGAEARLVLGTDMWYSRQIVVRPTAQWEPYTLTWTLPDRQGSLIFAQVENWGPGALYIDDAAITETDEKEAAPTSIVIDAAVERGNWPALYSGVDTAIICWESASFNQEVIDTMKAAGISQVRYSIFCDALNLILAGEDQWNWTTVDHHFEMFKSAGITPILAFHNTPNWMSRDGTRDTPPKDFEAWGKLVSEVVRHVNVEKKYGVKHFEVWNEPDLPFWKNGTPEDFVKLYDVFVKAVRSVDPKAKVGGPATSGSGAESGMVYRGAAQWTYLRAFIRHCGDNKVPLDFLSFHRYELDPGQAKLTCEEIRGWLQEYPHMRDAELFVSEWNIVPGKDRSGRMDTNFNASAATAWMVGAMDGGLDLAAFFNFSDAAWPAPGVLFQQETGLVAPDCTPKPVYNAMRLWSMLDKTRLLTIGNTSHTGAFATRGDDSISVLVYNHGGATGRVVEIENLPFDTDELTVDKYVIDGSHANAFALWRALKPVGKFQTPAFADGAWGKLVNAKDLTGEGWSVEGSGYRAGAPAGCNDKVLVAKNTGSSLPWSVDVPADGKYFLWVKADCTYYGGLLDVLADGKALGQVDTFVDGLDMRWFKFPAQLSAGKHEVKLVVSDAISKKLGWTHPRRTLAVDAIALTNDAEFAPKPLGGGPEAQAGVDLKVAAAPKAETRTMPGGKSLSLPLSLTNHSVVLIQIRPAK